MPASDSPTILVARYLQQNGYFKTLEAYLDESGLDLDSIRTTPESLTIEKVLEEKKLYDLAINLEQLNTEDQVCEITEFSEPYPSKPTHINNSSQPASNVIFVSISQFLPPLPRNLIISCTADRALRLWSTRQPEYPLIREFTFLHHAPILACIVLRKRYLLTCSMSGETALSDADTGEVLWRVKDHTKFVVKMELSPCGGWFATAGYDKLVNVYRVGGVGEGEAGTDADSEGNIVKQISLIGRITNLQTKPEAICFIPSSEYSSTPLLALSRTDCTSITYYNIPPPTTPSPSPLPALTLHITHHLTTPLTTFLTYTPQSLALSPTTSSPILAIGTSTTPHLKLLLLSPTTGKIHLDTFTEAPQTAYSNSIAVWRYNGSGIWLNGEDGVVRGVDAKNGKGKVELKGGHVGKVRCLAAGWVVEEGDDGMGDDGMGEVGAGTGTGRELLVSGGFDRKLMVWEVDEQASL